MLACGLLTNNPCRVRDRLSAIRLYFYLEEVELIQLYNLHLHYSACIYQLKCILLSDYIRLLGY